MSRPQFTTERIILAPGAAYDGRCDGATFEIWGCVSGAATLEAPAAGAPGGVPLPAVRLVLLPAALGTFAVRSAEGATLLRVFV